MYSRKFRAPVKETQKKAKKVFSSPYFFVKAATNAVGHNRFGIIISTAVLKKSVDRHFWKRKIASGLSELPNFKKDFLLIVSPGIKRAAFKEVEEEIKKLSKLF